MRRRMLRCTILIATATITNAHAQNKRRTCSHNKKILLFYYYFFLSLFSVHFSVSCDGASVLSSYTNNYAIKENLLCHIHHFQYIFVSLLFYYFITLICEIRKKKSFFFFLSTSFLHIIHYKVDGKIFSFFFCMQHWTLK